MEKWISFKAQKGNSSHCNVQINTLSYFKGRKLYGNVGSGMKNKFCGHAVGKITKNAFIL